MNSLIQLLIFTLDGYSFALELTAVHRVVRAFEVTPLPNAPTVILGVINVQGELAAVVNLRRRFRLPVRGMSSSDQFILVNMTTAATTRSLALVVDAITGIIEVE
jgi:purine-binding chemotaxis protein CheW